MNYPPPAVTDETISELVARCRCHEGLVLGLDFDGTLTPINDDPNAPHITRACRTALSRLIANPDVLVVVISGRSLEDLLPRVCLDGVIYGGNHGLELSWHCHHIAHPQAVRSRPALGRVAQRLADRLGDVPGALVEDKGLSLTVHTRTVPQGWQGAVRSGVEATVEDIGSGLALASGREVIEVRPANDWDKGAAMDAISTMVGDAWAPIYIGDDETDEDAFDAVRSDGVGIVVGGPRRTAAAYRLDHQGAVAPFLHRLAAGLLEN